MICKPCAIAGDLNRYHFNSDKLDPVYATVVSRLHDECKGCDCQHMTGDSHVNVNARGSVLD